MHDEQVPNDADRVALEKAHMQFKQQMLRQQENGARLQEIGGQLQLCMVAMARAQQRRNPCERLTVASIVIKHMAHFNNRTGQYAAALGAGVEQLSTELRDNEDRMAMAPPESP